MVLVFNRPDTPLLTLSTPPRLASWNATGHPDQTRLADYLDEVEALVSADLGPRGMALELNVGLPVTSALTEQRDLDNYLWPVINRLGHRRFDAVFASKTIAATSTIRVALARQANPPTPPNMQVRVTGSYERPEWKKQVAHACVAANPQLSADLPLRVDIAYELGPATNWTSRWKPTIDGLGPLLGIPNPAKPFDPNDGRITRLGLHRTENPSIGHDVLVAIWWEP